jgi:hypothetical protein
LTDFLIVTARNLAAAHFFSGELLDASSPGALGFYPWIDFERRLGGVLSTQSSFSGVIPVYLELKKELHQILP